MITEHLVDISRLQFAATALFHFLFVPLTLGMTWMLVIMEAVYLTTGKEIWKDMTRFWGKLFGINFVLGVTTGITMEFQFGTNWAYYSHYVGDVFGAPLAIEGLMAFFLESTMVGLFFFGWDRMSRLQHFTTTLLMALGTSLSALWILVANGWMQNPVGAEFNYDTMRMEMTSFAQIFLNPDAQNKFVHTVSAGYVTGALFVLGVSAWYLLKGRDIEFAKRSFHVASAFGFAAICSVIVLGDESGYSIGHAQQTKIAAIEAMWETEPAPASFNIIAGINEAEQKNDWAVHIPYLMGIIGTRSFDQQILGIHDIKKINEEKIKNGITAVHLLDTMRAQKEQGIIIDPAMIAEFDAHKADLGFGLLLKKYTNDVTKATPEMIAQAVDDSVPAVTPMFWTFRVMVAMGFLMLILFSLCLFFTLKGNFMQKKWLLKFAVLMIPAPWIAIEAGWFVAEYGRQPWTVYGVLPTHLSVSNIHVNDVLLSLAGFVVFYVILAIVEMYLMIKYVKLGPASLGTGKYYGEKTSPHIINPSEQQGV
ncbi:cytochrome ubiquinol oxidase subunit I [Moraxella sp. FZLJ2107]|uniref:cytochrome ubiquinol oxidase subunit I n=1 Tax=unclassified Moraxella TaxID=2685852 RepID=UPI0020C8ADFA|nr:MULTISPECIES: cytochrome ubiquinol oxidase subunit I [unclassified Moraxella]UTO05078.1 cytochrome ubiquinol oxidase subunit I [Moraxella sp. FZLJ2107]UTO21813.1 cytochrome ubiquinol oxidase subunit I [Moraxella sp. FZLJ2109]